jgi:xanthine dehydrogenase accessory factor
MRKLSELIVLIRGGGEVGSGIAHRLYRSRFRVCITEVESPLAVSRGTCFSEAVFDGSKTIEDVTAVRTLPTMEAVYKVWREGNIPLVVDPESTIKPILKPDVLINAMMLKRETNTRITDAPLVIGIGPGFTARADVTAVIESNHSNNLGRVIWEGKSEDDTREPVEISGLTKERVIWAQDSGVFNTDRNIGDLVNEGDVIGTLGDVALNAPMKGILRGLLRNDVRVLANAKLIEIDPVNDKAICFNVRGKMRAIGGGVLEAILQTFNVSESG